MPVAKDPSKLEFYVYTFSVDGYPFYVGIGRDQRGPDRLRYIRSLTPAKLKTKKLSDRVMVALDRKAVIKCSSTRKPLNRAEALELERKTIVRLLRKGYQLTNWQHNPSRHTDANKAVRAVLSKTLYAVSKS
ncbi:MAG: hypothetical protein Q8M31_05470 [Beijerinckiaceae bacterium]|nr:hypothetical protein [Beijerinckiaceae bacterium]